jgi:phosphohistidine phosphatase
MIYLLRHGDAEDSAGEDAARRLTAKGREQARNVGLALIALEATIDACLASPKVRTNETARLACGALEIEPAPTHELGGGAFDARALAAGRGEVLLVGHEPDLSTEIARLTGAKVRMAKASLAIIDGSTLAALLRTDDLAAIAR